MCQRIVPFATSVGRARDGQLLVKDALSGSAIRPSIWRGGGNNLSFLRVLFPRTHI